MRNRRSSRGARLVLIVLAAIAAVVAFRWFERQLAIDRCVDAGGCWDASRGACEFEDRTRC
jgi:hypothetical protein